MYSTEFQAKALTQLASEDVKNANGEVMAVSYQWTFTTGTLALTTPPPISPLIEDNPPIQPEEIKIIPRIKRIGVDPRRSTSSSPVRSIPIPST